MASEKEEIILDFKVEQGEAIKELEQTKVAIINLKKEQQDLNKAYKNGEKSTEEYAQELVKLEGELKKNNKAYNDNLKAINGVKTKFDELVDGLSSSIPGFQGVSGGFGKVTAAAKAFIATPIGAVVTALGLAIAAVTQYFRDNEQGQNRFNQIMNITGAIIGKVTDAVSALGGFLIDKLFAGFEFLGNVLSRVIPGFDELIAKTREYLNLDRADIISNLQAETDLLERQLIIDRARIQAKIAEAKLIAENKELSAAERAKGLREAIALQQELSAKETQFAENRLRILQEQNKQSNSNKEALKAEAEAEANLILVRKDAADKQKELVTKEQQLRQEDKLKREQEEAIQSEIDRAKRIADRERELVEEEQHQDRLIEIQNKSAKNALDNTSKLLGARVDANKKDIDNQKKAADLENLLQVQRVATIQATVRLGSQLLKEGTIAAKVASTAQAVVDTYAAANLALKSAPPPFGAILAGINVALGLANVAKMNNVTLAAGGGSFVTNGPHLMVVGDNPGGRERVDVTPISGRGKTSVGDGMIRMAGGGSVVANASSSRIDQSFAAANLFKDMNFSVSWREGNELGDKIRFKEDLTTA